MEYRFYRMSKTTLPAAVAKLAETVASRGMSLGIHTPDDARAREIDEALWRDCEFLPHSIDEPDGVSAIHISTDRPEGEVIFALDDAEIEADAKMICYLFHAVDVDVVETRRTHWKTLKDAGVHLTYWAENDSGAWEKLAEENG